VLFGMVDGRMRLLATIPLDEWIRPQRGIFSEGAPPAPYAFLSHQSDSVVAQLCTVKVRLTQRKPHDDFCGLLPIGRAPQIKLGNDAVESL
jgi:hypothetical protein